jgi:hypothetical protein
MQRNYSRAVFSFMIKNNINSFKALAAAIVVTVLLAFIKFRGWNENFLTDLWQILEPITGIATLGVALVVLLGENQQEWESSLPKRLTVNFLYDGKYVMRCEKAYLAAEGDIRAWGQQLGRQMVALENLMFKSQIEQLPPTLEIEQRTVNEENIWIKTYEVSFSLSKLPAALIPDEINQGKCLVWRMPKDPEYEKFTHQSAG